MDDPKPETGRVANPLPYATPPPADPGERAKALAIIALVNAAATMGLFLFAGGSWPAVAAVGILAIVVIAFGHFLTRGPT